MAEGGTTDVDGVKLGVWDGVTEGGTADVDGVGVTVGDVTSTVLQANSQLSYDVLGLTKVYEPAYPATKLKT